jgi:hypothetical protein
VPFFSCFHIRLVNKKGIEYFMIYHKRGGKHMSEFGHEERRHGGSFTSIGAILVLFILLVIISKAFLV